MPSTLGIVASGQNFPLSLSPALWLDASDTSTITEVAGAVSQWNDKSGNGRNLTQGTGASQPTTGSATVNSLNAISFGTAAFMGTASFSLSQPFTVVVAFRTFANFTTSGAAAFAIMWDDNRGGNRPILGGRNSPPSAVGMWMFANTLQTTATALANSTGYKQFGYFNGASSKIRLNGSDVTLGGSPGAANLTSGVRLGGDGNTTRAMSDMCEIIVVAGAMSAAITTEVDDYIAAKWGF